MAEVLFKDASRTRDEMLIISNLVDAARVRFAQYHHLGVAPIIDDAPVDAVVGPDNNG